MSLPLNGIPKPVTSFVTSLAADIVAGASSLIVKTATDDAGNALSGIVGLVIDGGTAKAEVVIGTKSGATVSSLITGVDPQDGTTAVTSLKFDHKRGASVVVTDAPFLQVAYRLLNADEGFPNILKYGSAKTPTYGSFHIPTWDHVKDYIDAAAIAGCVPATTINAGIVKQATLAQALAGTETDGGYRLAVTPDVLQTLLQRMATTYLVEDGVGSDDTYTAAATPTLAAYTAGQTFRVKLTVANTAAASLNIDSLGAKTVKKWASGSLADLETGDILANMTCLFLYDGTYMVMLNPSGTMPTLALLSEMATFFGATDITGAEAEGLTSGGMSYLAVASDNLRISADTERSLAGGTYTKEKEIIIAKSGTYRVKFDLKQLGGSNAIYGRIYKNGSAVGTERSTVSGTYATFSEDIQFAQGDLLQLYLHGDGASSSAYGKNLRLYFDLTAYDMNGLFTSQVITN